jgi:CBS domain-containing protein
MTMRVAEVMTSNVVAVRRIAEFKDIVEVMRRRQMSAFPVLDDDDRVIGVVSEADLLPREAYPVRLAAPRRGECGEYGQRGEEPVTVLPAKARAMTAAELMTSPAVTVTAGTTVTEAAKIMYARRIKRLPVVDAEGRLIGIVSRIDLLGVYVRPDAEIRDEVIQRVIIGEFGLDPRELTVTVSAGVVTIAGPVERDKLAVSLLRAIWAVVGVVEVRDRLSYPVRG